MNTTALLRALVLTCLLPVAFALPAEAAGTDDTTASPGPSAAGCRAGSPAAQAARTADPDAVIRDCDVVFFREPHLVVSRPVDGTGSLSSRSARARSATAQRGSGDPLVPLLAPPSETFHLESRPGANVTLYLDFDGESVTGTRWNEEYKKTVIEMEPFSFDEGRRLFSKQELAVIQNVWAAVAEDFAPFGVNVTTAEPSEEALVRDQTSDRQFGTRLVVSSGSKMGRSCACSGMSFLRSFAAVGGLSRSLRPGFVFADDFARRPKLIADVASHEFGHGFGLDHDGVTSPNGRYTYDYFGGYAPWAPMMGAGFIQPLTQWSRGEYDNATNQQDDLAMIAKFAGRAVDDAPNGIEDPQALPLLSSDGVPVTGLIGLGASADQMDRDVFRIDLSEARDMSVVLRPREATSALDSQLELFDLSTGELITSATTPTRYRSQTKVTGLGARLQVSLPPGQYAIAVSGVGGQASETIPYSAYGSLGTYLLTASPAR